MIQKSGWGAFASAALLLNLLVVRASADDDADGCKDQYLSRMAGFYLAECDIKDFEKVEFTAASAEEQPHVVEGRVLRQVYRINGGVKAPSPLSVLRNYENVLRKDGWTVVHSNQESEVTAHKKQSGHELWGELQYNDGNQYTLLFAEPAALQQSVTTADQMLAGLNQQGHVSLDVQFDTRKATLRPDGQLLVDQIITLLRSNPGLKLAIEGHTDNVGDAKSNKALSAARAKTVMAALIRGGIDKSRLSSAGFGAEQPVADNATEQGRQQNRRVELVKR